MEKLINVVLVGSAWKNGRKIPGWKQLETNERKIYTSEFGGFDQAIKEAKEAGIDTKDFEVKLSNWVLTGQQ